MTTINKYELELAAFKAECKVIDLKHEYNGYKEDVRWAIATSLSEVTLRAKYGKIIAQYEPFLLLTEEHAKIIIQFHSNDRKHQKRYAELGDAYCYEDSLFEKFHPELVENPFDDSSDMTWLYEALDKLDPLKKERVKKHYLEGFSVAEIAAAEGVSVQSVYKSITRALKKLEKILENG